ncbi:HAD-IIA family hydrolase [Limimaricola hongkongensis]|uniref:HAD superfamily protein involved in N-acetyl-glucosamine catabolism n=1 Tax=Limimaricola hongkongensis DSM 17492 TaxID=1122180 RepID=A0A017H9K0_9RHOB|nr:HAD-IIA family hydrolase [Limimaricola hongkongensis]EYD70459.1 HAD superfamily protein involved in N-acetyl-glucosamine catabolism [Limimaricola hongkongensis DSM 17492]
MTGPAPDGHAAFAAYLAIRHRLPPAPPGAGFGRAADLGAIAAPFDVILFDAYGVLNVGETPILGAARRIAELRESGKRVMVVSNSAGYPKRAMMRRFESLGFDFAPDEVVTSREALFTRLGYAPPRLWGVMLGPGHGLREFEGIDAHMLLDDAAAYDRAEGFLLVGADGWTDRRQRLLAASLRARPRPVLVGNPDLVAPREGGLTLEPGHFAHALADDGLCRPEFCGKPFRTIFDLALARLDPAPDPARVLMVGDTLHTDILGARAMGFATALVTDHGPLAGADVVAAIDAAGIMPDFVIPHI